MLMLLLYLLFMVGMLIVGFYAYVNSDLDALLHQRDYMGNYCNGTGNLYLVTPPAGVATPGLTSQNIPGLCVPPLVPVPKRQLPDLRYTVCCRLYTYIV